MAQPLPLLVISYFLGMMRFGRLLAEGSPHNLLIQYDKISLEDVFLELCMKDNDFDALGDEIDGPQTSIIKKDSMTFVRSMR